MILVSGTARFGEREIERLKEAMTRNIAATRAEPGCDHYAYAIDLADPNLLHISECWADETALEAHASAPHLAEFMAVLREAKVESLSVEAYRAEHLRTLF